MGDAYRSHVKGQQGRQKTPSAPHPPMHPGLGTRVCTGEASWGPGSCMFGFFGFSVSPPGTVSPWHGGGAETRTEKPQKLWRNVWENQDGARVAFLEVRRKRHYDL